MVKSQFSIIFHGETTIFHQSWGLNPWFLNPNFLPFFQRCNLEITTMQVEVRHLVYRFQRLANLSSPGTVDFGKMQLLEAGSWREFEALLHVTKTGMITSEYIIIMI